MLILSPITLVYASSFVKFVANNPHTTKIDVERFDKLAAVTMYFVVLTFCISLIFVVTKFVFFSSYKINEFKMWLGAAETGFGALIGIVFEKLLGVAVRSRTTDRPT
jgi:hypothetical protein